MRGSPPAIWLSKRVFHTNPTQLRLCRRTRREGAESSINRPLLQSRAFLRAARAIQGCHSSLACQSARQTARRVAHIYTGDAAGAEHNRSDAARVSGSSPRSLETHTGSSSRASGPRRATPVSGIADACATTLANGGAPLSRDRAAPPAHRSSSRYCRGAEGAALDVVDLSFERYIGAPTPEAHVHRHRSWAALSPVQRDGAAVVRSLRAT